MNADDDSRLDEFDKDEWREVCRRLRPDVTDIEYEAMWNDFQERKADGRLNPQ